MKGVILQGMLRCYICFEEWLISYEILFKGEWSVEYIVNSILGLAEGGYGPLVNTGKLNTFKSYYSCFDTFSLLLVSFFCTF
jgi:hypothetical protein